MITELVLLLGFLAFLCIRTDFISRRWVFVIAILAWGAARFCTEFNFSGEQYTYGTLVSYGAAAGLVVCLLAMFFACSGDAGSAKHDGQEGVGELSSGESDESPGQSPSARIESLLSERD
ncbi:MAG: hypothetical protein KAI66_24465 [Lentisphaeria bacterium]|nr:hypothetical protein [Lentisphaeria bacterium]